MFLYRKQMVQAQISFFISDREAKLSQAKGKESCRLKENSLVPKFSFFPEFD